MDLIRAIHSGGDSARGYTRRYTDIRIKVNHSPERRETNRIQTDPTGNPTIPGVGQDSPQRRECFGGVVNLALCTSLKSLIQLVLYLS